MGLIVLWVKYFGPKPPVQPPQANRPAQTAPATPGQATSPVGNASPTSASPAALTPAAPVSVTPKSDSQERTIVVENDLYRVEISNRGAVGNSWQLKKYNDDAKPPRGLGWVGGFGALTVTNPVPIETVNTNYSEGGKITNYQYKKLEGLDKWNPGSWQGGKDFVGIEDRYFTAAFLPANGATPGALETRYWKTSRTFQVNGQDTQEPVPQVAAATPAQPLALRV